MSANALLALHSVLLQHLLRRLSWGACPGRCRASEIRRFGACCLARCAAAAAIRTQAALLMTRPLQVDEENALLMRETMTSALRLGSIPVVDPSQVCWLVRELGFGFSVTQYAAPGIHPCGRPISGVLAGADLHLISVRLLGLSQALR